MQKNGVIYWEIGLFTSSCIERTIIKNNATQSVCVHISRRWCIFQVWTVCMMRMQSGYPLDLFPWCARPIVQMCAIQSPSWALEASAYFIVAYAARLVVRAAQMVLKSPNSCTIFSPGTCECNREILGHFESLLISWLGACNLDACIRASALQWVA